MKLLYFDFCALIVLAILIFTRYVRGLTKGRAGGCFMNLLLVTGICIIADIFSVAFDGNPLVPPFLRYIANSSYIIIHNLSTPLYTIYLMILTDTDYFLRGYRRALFVAPFTIIIILTLLNPLTNWIFYFDSNYMYTRGPLFFTLYISAAFYVAHIIRLTIKYGRSLGLKSSLAISSLIPLMLIAVVVQFFFPELLVEMFANAMSLLLCSTLVSRPEDILDTETGLSNKKACADVLKRCLKNGKPLELILINITNYTLLENIVGYEGIVKILHTISGRILSANHNNDYFFIQ